MGLQIWIPLTGTLDNYGLMDVNVTSRSLEYSTSGGKINKQAASFIGDCKQYVSIIDAPKYQDNFSWACWFKLDKYNESTWSFIMSQGREYGLADYGFNIAVNNTTYPTLYIHAGKYGDSNTVINSGVTILLNTWYHVVTTVKNGNISIYLNGSLVKQQSLVGTKEIGYVSATGGLVIGKMSHLYTSETSHFPTNGLITDVRVYDHTLSKKEIKELSLGKVMHLPMNDIYNWKVSNIYTGTQSSTSWCKLTYNFKTDIFKDYGFDTALKMEPLKTSDGVTKFMAYSYLLSVADGGAGSLDATKTYAVSMYAYNSPDCNASLRLHLEQAAMWTKTHMSTTGQHLIDNTKGEVVHMWGILKPNQTTGKVYIMFYPNPNQIDVFTTGYQLFAGITIYESDTVVPPRPFDFDSIVYDMSGYGNHGIIEDVVYPSITDNSIVHDYSYKFSGDSSVKVTGLSNLGNVYEASVSFWCKISDRNNYKPIFFNWTNGIWLSMCCENSAIWGYFKRFGESSRYFRYGSKDDIQLDTWYHIVYTANNGVEKFYLNGTHVATNDVSAKDPYFVFGDQVWIGSKYASTWKGDTNGCISDVRVYVTELSATDISTLYNTRFILDSGCNVFASDIYEIKNSKPSYRKNGILRVDNINELGTLDMPLKITDDDKIWARIFYHDTKNGGLFKVKNEASCIQTSYKYSRLNITEIFRNTDGAFEFRLEYPREVPNKYNQWSQTDNPYTVTVPYVDNGTKVGGYVPIHIDWSSNYWGGLNLNTGNSSLLDGSIGHSNWYYAIGATSTWNPTEESPNNIPGPTVPVTEVELWVRIDNCKTLFEPSTIKQLKTGICASSFNET